MNEKKFSPRNAIRPVSTWLISYPKPGDRIRKKMIRLLFYELLVSTSQSLFFHFLEEINNRDSEKTVDDILKRDGRTRKDFKPIYINSNGFDWMLL